MRPTLLYIPTTIQLDYSYPICHGIMNRHYYMLILLWSCIGRLNNGGSSHAHYVMVPLFDHHVTVWHFMHSEFSTILTVSMTGSLFNSFPKLQRHFIYDVNGSHGQDTSLCMTPWVTRDIMHSEVSWPWDPGNHAPVQTTSTGEVRQFLINPQESHHMMAYANSGRCPKSTPTPTRTSTYNPDRHW